MESGSMLYNMCAVQIILGIALLCLRVPVPRMMKILMKVWGVLVILAGAAVMIIVKMLESKLALG